MVRRRASSWARWSRRVPRDDAGMGLPELLVAMVLLTLVFSGLAGVAITALRTLAIHRETQAASQTAQEGLERVRALAFNTLRIGVPTAQLDFAIQEGTTTATANAGKYYFDGEQMLATPITDPHSAMTQGTPLNPFQTEVVSSGSTFTVTTYPTCFEAAATASPACPTTGNPTIRVRVVVTWTSLDGHARTMENTSLFYSPSSCLSPDTHPYSSPCQAYFYGTAEVGGGTVAVSESVLEAGDEHPDAHPLNGSSLALMMPVSSANVSIEQVASATSQTSPVGIAVIDSGGGSVDYGGIPVSGSVSTDPADGNATADDVTLSQGATAAPSLSDEGLAISGSAGAAGGAVSSKTAAAVAQSPACLSMSGGALGTGHPCASSYGHATGDSSISLSGTHGYNFASSVVWLAAGSAEPRTSATLWTSPGTGTCTQASASVGCVTAGAAGPLPTLRVGGLPAGLTAPAGWSAVGAFLEVSGVSPTTSAQQTGPAGATGTVSLGAPVLKYWNGAGYTTLGLTASTVTANTTLLGPDAERAIPSAAATDRVVITPDLTYGSAPTATAPSAGAACTPGAPCTTVADVSALLGGTLRIRYYHSGNVELDLTVSFALKGARSAATYQAAPVAN